tara:strand:- start:4981 stop:6210 length:1230 start_codon:yes stop_codon:yes gene_type:complete
MPIQNCRACDSENIETVFDLGNQVLTGVFLTEYLDSISSGPVALVACEDCGLVQMKYSYPLDEMYNDGYGYQSGLTSYMSNHLKGILNFASNLANPNENDTVLDIGCNDGTLLNHYPKDLFKLIGIDPVAKKYLNLYPANANVVTDFFNQKNYFSVTSDKAKIITSISMFYDLEEPVQFAKDISNVLSKEGVWVFEQSYLPAMLRANSYDTICQEHVEYYSLTAIQNILDQANLTIVDASQNEVNGGSVRLAAAHNDSEIAKQISPEAKWLLQQEKNHDIFSNQPWKDFEKNVERHKLDLINLLTELKNAGKKVVGYGASTKGNVILQYCDIGPDLLPVIGDITPSKDGAYTPGSKIPIISMEKLKAMKPDYYLVLPWGFRSDIILREKETIANGAKFIFPLPFVEIIS